MNKAGDQSTTGFQLFRGGCLYSDFETLPDNFGYFITRFWLRILVILSLSGITRKYSKLPKPFLHSPDEPHDESLVDAL